VPSFVRIKENRTRQRFEKSLTTSTETDRHQSHIV